MARLHGRAGRLTTLFGGSRPSCRRLFGPLCTIVKGYWSPFYHTKRFLARAGAAEVQDQARLQEEARRHAVPASRGRRGVKLDRPEPRAAADEGASGRLQDRHAAFMQPEDLLKIDHNIY